VELRHDKKRIGKNHFSSRLKLQYLLSNISLIQITQSDVITGNMIQSNCPGDFISLSPLNKMTCIF